MISSLSRSHDSRDRNGSSSSSKCWFGGRTAGRPARDPQGRRRRRLPRHRRRRPVPLARGPRQRGGPRLGRPPERLHRDLPRAGRRPRGDPRPPHRDVELPALVGAVTARAVVGLVEERRPAEPVGALPREFARRRRDACALVPLFPGIPVNLRPTSQMNLFAHRSGSCQSTMRSAKNPPG